MTVLIPVSVLILGAASITCSLVSFRRKCAAARRNLDPIRAGAPRGCR